TCIWIAARVGVSVPIRSFLIRRAKLSVSILSAGKRHRLNLSIDEKPSIQALERAQGYIGLPNGRAGSVCSPTTGAGCSPDYREVCRGVDAKWPPAPTNNVRAIE